MAAITRFSSSSLRKRVAEAETLKNYSNNYDTYLSTATVTQPQPNAVNTYAFAHDDPKLGHLRRLPHPDNLSVSWGRLLANTLKTGFHCEAESAASNARIMRTTREWLRNNRKP
jgi:hypothetical protein